MEDLLKLFKFFNRRKFLIEICELDPDSGVNHRLIGIGTNALDKKNGPTEEEISKIKNGLEVMENKIRTVREKL